MIALQILKIGNFMSKLLTTESFDSFLLEEAMIRMDVAWTIDGHLNKSFFLQDNDIPGSPCPAGELVPWGNLRRHFFDIIKGKKTPSSFRFVMHYPERSIPRFLEEHAVPLSDAVSGLLMNIHYDGSTLRIITGISYGTFTLDKSAEAIWDQAVCRFLTQKEIDWQEM